ncbi:hypothetical protein KIN20_013842 [Parelaphostrongylus tenuis]|nr:hypothetical protein KIN20_013842 [Parelaphostrongylus tenuis]
MFKCSVCKRKVKRTTKVNGVIWRPKSKSEPEPSLNEACTDDVNFCRALEQMGVLYCNFDYIRKSCCATCNAVISGDGAVFMRPKMISGSVTEVTAE